MRRGSKLVWGAGGPSHVRQHAQARQSHSCCLQNAASASRETVHVGQGPRGLQKESQASQECERQHSLTRKLVGIPHGPWATAAAVGEGFWDDVDDVESPGPKDEEAPEESPEEGRAGATADW